MAIEASSLARQERATFPVREAVILEFPTPTLPQSAVIYEARPMAPSMEALDPGPEPVYGSVTAKQWELWVANKEARSEYFARKKRAEDYAIENDLRGTF